MYFKSKYFFQMVPYDLPLHSGIMPRLVITIDAEPVPGADRYIHPPVLLSLMLRNIIGCFILTLWPS